MSGAAVAGTVWLLGMALLVIMEMITQGLTSIWFAFGALAASIAAYLGCGMVVQIVLFAVFSAAFIVALRPLARKKTKVGAVATNLDSLMGKTVPLTEELSQEADKGRVKIGDVDWRVVAAPGTSFPDSGAIPVGTKVEILKVEGSHLIVKPV